MQWVALKNTKTGETETYAHVCGLKVNFWPGHPAYAAIKAENEAAIAQKMANIGVKNYQIGGK